MKEIEITIDAQGNATVDAAGFAGQSCKAATKAFEEALGGTITSDVEKAEMRAPQRAVVAQQQKLDQK